MPFFKKQRTGPGIGKDQGAGKKLPTSEGPQHHLLGNKGTNGKIPITKKAKSNIA